jgi:hypothetical protein
MFPESTIIGRKIPKKSFYENVQLSTSIKKKFVEQIDRIVFANKFSKDTLNIPKTADVEEVFMFDISLKDNAYLERIEGVLGVIDQSVPYPILYQFKLRESVIYKIAYKKRNKNDPNKSVVDVYLTKKIPVDELDTFSKKLDGIFNALDMEILYENLIKLFLLEQKGSLEESIEEEKKQIYALSEIGRLEKLMIREKQPDRQYEIHKKILGMKEELSKSGEQ